MHQPRRPRSIVRFIVKDDGATLMEYALIGALVSVIVAIAVLALAGVKF
jgi:Flp pilus assembly pilin Flp